MHKNNINSLKLNTNLIILDKFILTLIIINIYVWISKK
jgi:hypothetical protein